MRLVWTCYGVVSLGVITGAIEPDRGDVYGIYEAQGWASLKARYEKAIATLSPSTTPEGSDDER